MPRILKYTINPALLAVLLCITLACVTTPSRAQYRSDRKYGFRIGFDLSRIPVHYLNPYRTDLEIQTDLRVDSDLYVAFDGGWNKTHLENKPVFEYNSNGYFVKAGVDYNLLKRKYPGEANMLYVGFRYGIARMRRNIPEYQISDPYWGNVDGHFSSKTLLPQWGELIVGLKAEVLNNLFLGWSLHLRILTTQNIDKQVRPYLIPGFGKATKNSVFDVNYSISYRIPLFHPKPKKKKPEPEKKASVKTAKKAAGQKEEAPQKKATR
jgi:hypothetical protein